MFQLDVLRSTLYLYVLGEVGALPEGLVQKEFLLLGRKVALHLQKHPGFLLAGVVLHDGSLHRRSGHRALRITLVKLVVRSLGRMLRREALNSQREGHSTA